MSQRVEVTYLGAEVIALRANKPFTAKATGQVFQTTDITLVTKEGVLVEVPIKVYADNDEGYVPARNQVGDFTIAVTAYASKSGAALQAGLVSYKASE